MNVQHFSEFPKAYLAYPKIIKNLLIKPAKIPAVLPEVKYVVDQFNIDAAHLKRYNDICGFKKNGYIPAIYLAVLSQSLQMQMMSREAFPFAILGLVHIRNQIEQTRKVGVNEILTLSCEFGEVSAHEKGLQFDFVTIVSVNDDVVMRGVTTYLSRQKNQLKVQDKVKVSESEGVLQPQAQWQLAENLGRRYALISGDFNLIHLHALSAKVFGFKQAIAHGMWSKAHALAQLNLPEAYQVDVWFKLPMHLPSTVALLTAQTAQETHFLIRDQASQRPHVSGVIRCAV